MRDIFHISFCEQLLRMDSTLATPGKSALGKIRSKQQAEINTTELGRLSPTLYTSLLLEFHIRRRKFRKPLRAT